MDILKINYISEADVTLFDIRLSESEVIIYADCLNYVQSHLSDEQIYEKTECSNQKELLHYLEDLKNLLKSMEHKNYLPDRYKDL